MIRTKKRIIVMLAAAMMLTATFGVGTASAATDTDSSAQGPQAAIGAGTDQGTPPALPDGTTPPEPPTDEDGNPLAPPTDEDGNPIAPPDKPDSSDSDEDQAASEDQVPQVDVSTLKAGKHKLTVKFDAVEDADSYQIAVKKKGGDWKTTNTTNTSKTIKNLKSKAKYQVKVRALDTQEDGTVVAGSWSETKAIKVR